VQALFDALRAAAGPESTMRTTILDAAVAFSDHPFVAPLIISSGTITQITQATATVRVRVGGREAEGKGAIYLSDLWAWPDPGLTHDERDAALRALCGRIADRLWALCGAQAMHPLELGLLLHEHVCGETSPPPLARAMCASPFDAAIHDAVGRALGCSAFALYDADAELPTADPYFAGRAGDAIRRVLAAPRRALDAWYIVGKNDGEAQLRPWVRERGYRCFKIKILGRDSGEDVARTVEVFRMARALGATSVALSVDTNEANPDAASVMEYLLRLREADAAAFAALGYFEQPTGRDIRVHRFDWREAAALKPILLDEGLTHLDLMPVALDQGWSGFALKTCKGHSFALTAAAWAREHGQVIAMQDLTNPGLALIHAALFAAHVPTINGVELNSPQFTPAANAAWLPRNGALFEPRDGQHRLPMDLPVGLGSGL
jgi:L-alanine-DL-glutamate epimerase-like enolase superfamily enzyme